MKTKISHLTLFSVGFIPFAVGFFGKHHFLPDLFSHFRMYYALYFSGLIFFSIYKKERILTIISGTTLIFIISSLIIFYIPKSSPVPGESLRLCSMNLFSGNQEHEKVLEYLNERDFDIIIFQELTPTWQKKLTVLDRKYPYGKSRQLNSNFGISIKSKLPFKQLDFLNLSRYEVPTIVGSLDIKGKKLTVIGTHPVPPTNPISFEDRNNQFKKLNKIIQNTSEEIIVAGDLNCSSWSPNFSYLTNSTGLRGARIGFGIQPTWWADVSILSIPIDHILVSKGIEILQSKVGENIGSDHLPKEIEFQFK